MGGMCGRPEFPPEENSSGMSHSDFLETSKRYIDFVRSHEVEVNRVVSPASSTHAQFVKNIKDYSTAIEEIDEEARDKDQSETTEESIRSCHQDYLTNCEKQLKQLDRLQKKIESETGTTANATAIADSESHEDFMNMSKEFLRLLKRQQNGANVNAKAFLDELE